MIMCQNKIPLSERVYEAIREIEREKIVSNIFPYHALLIKDLCEKLKIPMVDIYWACVELYKQGYTPPRKTDFNLFAPLRRRELCETF